VVLEAFDFAVAAVLGLADFGIEFNSNTAAAGWCRIFAVVCFDVGFG
jgi:hypothetical protein